jgi:hypothetical protein
MFAKKILFLLLVVICMVSVIFAQSKGNIVFVSYQVDTKIDPETNDYPDMPHIYALEDEGYNVIIFYNDSLSIASEATLDTLYGADLIIMGRSTPSPGYGDHKQAWNDITTPILNLELWNARNNRLNWFNTTTMASIADDGVVFNATIDVPDDPVFEGWDTSAPIPWVIGPYDAIGVKEAGNGTVLARMESDSTVLFVRFEPGIEFYEGSVDMPAGLRTVIGNGRDVSGAAPFDYYNFTAESEQIFLAEVARMVALGQSGSAVANRENPSSPSTFTLSQNYPNPFNPNTTISFHLPTKSSVLLRVFDIQGQEITTLINGELETGSHSLQWNAVNQPSGVYFYQLSTSEGFSQTKEMALLK